MAEKKAPAAPRAAKKTTQKATRPRGRPAMGKSQPNNVRDEKRNQKLIEEGGRILRTVRLDREASEALDRILTGHKSIREAIKAAIIGWDSICVESHNK
ncbi:hypothetical protein [Burkholderia gladioli]|uniref:hypothetical protein n=1 Tax=Burkholderia gladioli TaxID=28095 RepID=UPI0016400F58|nr:hypothetical protein [Burkholderia gladioli]